MGSQWGGMWTDTKLKIFEKYVVPYLSIMNKYRDRYGWKLIYLDVFAGSGERLEKNFNDVVSTNDDLFAGYEKDGRLCRHKESYKSAAERVVSVSNIIRGFDKYIFVDKKESNIEALKKRLSSYGIEEKSLFLIGDANVELKKICKGFKKGEEKGFAILDPFGMDIDWEALECLKNLAVDLWVLVPTGVAVNRLLPKRGLSDRDKEKLLSFFGITYEELYKHFYTRDAQPSLFGEGMSGEVKKGDPIRRIVQLYISRLKSLFTYVTEEPLVLKNSKNSTLYHFIFASQNKVAHKIATEIISKL